MNSNIAGLGFGRRPRYTMVGSDATCNGTVPQTDSTTDRREEYGAMLIAFHEFS